MTDIYADLPEAPAKKAKGDRGTWRVLADFAKAHGFEHGEGFATGGHNKGSLHYTGEALDIRIHGKTPAQIKDFMRQAAASGFNVRDERTRPAGQEVWGGPHVHLSLPSVVLGPSKGEDIYSDLPNAGASSPNANPKEPYSPAPDMLSKARKSVASIQSRTTGNAFSGAKADVNVGTADHPGTFSGPMNKMKRPPSQVAIEGAAAAKKKASKSYPIGAATQAERQAYSQLPKSDAERMRLEAKALSDADLAKTILMGPGADGHQTGAFDRFQAAVDEATDRITSAGAKFGDHPLFGGPVGKFLMGHLAGLGAGVTAGTADAYASMGKASSGQELSTRDKVNIASVALTPLLGGEGAIAAGQTVKTGAKALLRNRAITKLAKNAATDILKVKTGGLHPTIDLAPHVTTHVDLPTLTPVEGGANPLATIIKNLGKKQSKHPEKAKGAIDVGALPEAPPLEVVDGGKAPQEIGGSATVAKPPISEAPVSHLTKAERAEFWAMPYDAMERTKAATQAIIDAHPANTAEHLRAVDAMKIIDERIAQRAAQHPIPPTTDLEGALKQSIEAKGGTVPAERQAHVPPAETGGQGADLYFKQPPDTPDLWRTEYKAQEKYGKWEGNQAKQTIATGSIPPVATGGLKDGLKWEHIKKSDRRGVIVVHDGTDAVAYLQYETEPVKMGVGVEPSAERIPYIEDVEVRSGLRGKGLGTQVYETWLDQMAKEGFDKARLGIISSTEAKRVWSSLEKKGYKLNPRADDPMGHVTISTRPEPIHPPAPEPHSAANGAEVVKPNPQLTRARMVGGNTGARGTIEFASKEQMDAYDAAAAQKYLRTETGKTKNSSRVIKAQERIANYTPEQLDHARKVYEDVQAQMKGMAEDEHRRAVDNVGAAPKPEGAPKGPQTTAQTPKTEGYGASNKIITKAKLDQATKDLLEGGGFAGLDPKKLKALGQIGAYHLEAGVREFGAWSAKVVEHVRGSLGDVAAEKVKPHLRAIWQDAHVQIGEKAPRLISQRVLEAATETTKLFRFFNLSSDLGVLLRQAGETALNDPVQWAKSIAKGLKNSDAASLAKYYTDLEGRQINGVSMKDVRANAGLRVTGVAEHEEGFASRIASKIPGVSRLENAQKAMLDSARIERFDAFYRKFPDAKPAELERYARYLNSATGKSNVASVPKALEAVMTSPRWTASRWEMAGRLSKMPQTVYDAVIKRDKAAAQEAKNLGRYALALYGTAKLAGAELDPRSSDFLKIRVGGQVFDPTAGVAAPIRTALRLLLMLAPNETAPGVTGTDFKHSIPGEVGKYLVNTVSPGFTTPYGMITGKSLSGFPLDDSEKGVLKMMPLVAQGAWQAYQKDGSQAATIAFGADFFGINTSTYPKGKPYEIQNKKAP